MIDAQVVKAHAIDDSLGFRQAEDPGFWVARLRAWRHGANFDKTETQLRKPVDGCAVLVEAGSQPDRVGEVESHHRYRHFCRCLAYQAIEPQTTTGTDQVQGQIVGVSGESLNNSWRARVYMGGLDSD